MTELTKERLDQDAKDGYLLALHELRMKGIREGTIQPLSEDERREAYGEQ